MCQTYRVQSDSVSITDKLEQKYCMRFERLLVPNMEQREKGVVTHGTYRMTSTDFFKTNLLNPFVVFTSDLFPTPRSPGPYGEI